MDTKELQDSNLKLNLWMESCGFGVGFFVLLLLGLILLVCGRVKNYKP